MDQVGDLGSAVWQGVRSTGRTFGASVDTFVNNRPAVERAAADDALACQEQPLAQRALLAEIGRGKAADPQPSVISAIRNVGAAMFGNPSGSAQLVASQVPNTVVTLGAGLAGAKGGAALGALTGPFAPIAVPVLGTAGFLGGMFLGNTALETGSKAIEKAGDGFTEAERSEALREGAIKGGVITGIDAATLGIGGKVAKTLGRAAQDAGVRSQARVLTDAGVNAAERTALEAALRTNPALRQAVTNAAQVGARGARTLPARAGQYGGHGSLDSPGLK